MSEDTSAHPMYYTEAYHRALVDRDLYGLEAGAGGGVVGAVGGALLAGRTIKLIEANADVLANGTFAMRAGEKLSGAARFSMRSTGVILGAAMVGAVAAKIGQAVGYVPAIAKGPRPQQLNGWTGKIENERAAPSEKTL